MIKWPCFTSYSTANLQIYHWMRELGHKNILCLGGRNVDGLILYFGEELKIQLSVLLNKVCIYKKKTHIGIA